MFEALKAKVEAEFQALLSDARSLEEKGLAFFDLGAQAHARHAAEAQIKAIIEDTAKTSDEKLAALTPLVKAL